MDAQLPFTSNNAIRPAIEHSESTTSAVADSAIVMQDNDNDDVLWCVVCVKCGDTCECDWR
jgi:hypothetical protein